MTDLTPPGDSVAQTAYLRAPRGLFWMLLSAPFLLAAGAFVTLAMQPYVAVRTADGDAVLMAWIGAIMLCLGVAFLIAGITLAGVRSMLQQQADLLPHPEGRGE